MGSADFSKRGNISGFCPYGGVVGRYTGANMVLIHEIQGKMMGIFGEKHNWGMDASK